jgi:hypothetical protein
MHRKRTHRPDPLCLALRPTVGRSRTRQELSIGRTLSTLRVVPRGGPPRRGVAPASSSLAGPVGHDAVRSYGKGSRPAIDSTAEPTAVNGRRVGFSSLLRHPARDRTRCARDVSRNQRVGQPFVLQSKAAATGGIKAARLDDRPSVRASQVQTGEPACLTGSIAVRCRLSSLPDTDYRSLVSRAPVRHLRRVVGP